jgi:1,4-dihydroxy-2-naphthoyl-CoA hydrolase
MSDEFTESLERGDLQAFSDTVNFPRHIGIQLTKAEKNCIEGKLPVTEKLTNHLPNVHGGAIMSLADAMGAIGAHLNMPEGAAGTTTIESKTNFIKPAMQGDTLHAVCTPLSTGRRLSVWQTDITRDDGKRVAVVTQTQIYL